MNPLERILRKELYRKSFYEFVKGFWSETDPSKFVDGKIIKLYCEIFEYFCRQWTGKKEAKNVDLPIQNENIDIIDVRQNKQNLCLNVPPRHSKSQIFNVMGPTWLRLNSIIKAVTVSHTADLSTSANEKRQRIISSDLFKELYSDEMTFIANTKSFIKDDKGGELYSINRNSFTGYGADLIINDDLTNAETARKDREEMNNAWSYYQNTMPSRINDVNKCIILNIQQRLAPNDITGHIMNDKKLSSRYCFVVLPAKFEKDTYVVCPMSGEILFWKKDEYLWPERFADYQFLRDQVGETVFETQYLQKPIASDKTVLKESMLCEKDACDVPSIEQADMIYASHDFPVKDKESSDFLGSCLAYRVGSTLYITDSLEKHLAFVKSVEYVEHLYENYPGIIQVIEDKANGSPILQQLQDKVPGLQAFQPGTQSKVQRLESASLYMTSKNVVFVKTKFNKFTNQWEYSDSMLNLRKRLLDFPFVEHDDIVDSISMLVLFVFMEKRYQVYGRAFNDDNIIDINNYKYDYSTIFFNKEGDVWKVSEIGIKYSEQSQIVLIREKLFKASMEEGLNKLKEFSPKNILFIDCSANEGLSGISNSLITIERYEDSDFDKSIAKLNLEFSKKNIKIDKNCVMTKADIENFKFSKSKDENVKYLTEKDGFIANLRIALKYYGI